MTPHACPCQITLPRQALCPGTVPLLQGWPGSCHAWLCDAFRPMCLLLPHAVCVCKTAPGSHRGPAASQCCIISPAQVQKPIPASSVMELEAGIQCYSLSCPCPQGTWGLALLPFQGDWKQPTTLLLVRLASGEERPSQPRHPCSLLGAQSPLQQQSHGHRDPCPTHMKSQHCG